MNENRRQSWTLYDAMYALVVVPLLIVAAMIFAGAVSWREQSEQGDRVWAEVISSIQAGDSLAWAKWYDQHTSRAQTLNFKSALEASDAIMAQLDACSPDLDLAEIIAVTPPDQILPFESIISELAEEAQPIMQLLVSIPESEANAWHPVILDGANLQLPNVLRSRNLIRLLKIEFLDAYHKGDNERAVEALNLLDRFYGPDSRSLCVDDEMVRRDAANVMRKLILFSLVHDVWTEADLADIQKLVSRDFDWQQRWQDVVRGEMLRDPPWRDKEVYGYGSLLSMMAPRSRLAPSEKLELAERHTAIASTDNVATPQHYSNMLGIQQLGNQDAGWAPDQWIQFPQLNSDWREYRLNKNYADIAHDFADEAIEKRLAQCAVAVKRFAALNDRLPDSLDELATVGLQPDFFKDKKRPRLRYETGKDGSAATLRSSSVRPSAENNKRDRPSFWNTSVITK